MKVFWTKCGYRHGNFGDELTPLILRYVGVPCEWVPPEEAEMFGIGSIVEEIPSGFRGVVWTSGAIDSATRKDLTQAVVFAVRGRLTQERLMLPGDRVPMLGDGGLLSYLFARPRKKKFALGIIPHYLDLEDTVVKKIASQNSGIRLIDICDEPMCVIRNVQECQSIFSSSLHGLILADSLGIPSEWIELNNGPEVVIGGGFKFRDYYTVFGIEGKKPLRLDPEDAQLDRLLEAFEDYSRPGIDFTKEQMLESLKRLSEHARRPYWKGAFLDATRRDQYCRKELIAGGFSHTLPYVEGSAVERTGEVLSVKHATPFINRDAFEMQRFFRDCLSMLEQLHGRNFAHRNIGNATLFVADGQPALVDFGWAIHENNGGRASKDFGDDVCAIGKIFADINERRYPAFDSIIELMTYPDERLRLTDIATLKTLVTCVAEGRSDGADAVGAQTGSDGKSPSGFSELDRRAIGELLDHVSRRGQALLEAKKEVNRLTSDLWIAERELAIAEIERFVEPTDKLVLVDGGEWAVEEGLISCSVVPFLERDGQYWGAPPDDDIAIEELTRLRSCGANFIAFVSPAFWWFDCYSGFNHYLRDNFVCLVESKRCVVFDLHSATSTQVDGHVSEVQTRSD